MNCPNCSSPAQVGWEILNFSSEVVARESRGYIEVGYYDTEDHRNKYQIEGDVSLYTCPKCSLEFATR